VVGLTIREALEEVDHEADVTQLIRDGRYVSNPPLSTEIQSDDVYTVRLTNGALQTLINIEGIDLVPGVTTEADLDSLAPEQTLVEIVLTAGSNLIGETIESARFSDAYHARVLAAVRRGGRITHERLAEFTFRPGDALLIESEAETVDRLADDPNVIVAGDLDLQQFRSSKLPVAIGVVLVVVGLAAVGLLPIMVAALAGVVTMLAAGVIKPAEAYEAVQWDIIFLLAGVIPLGNAMAETGGADILGALVVSSADVLPAVGVLGLFYLLTALMTNVVSNQASVVLLVPVAVDVAGRLGANAFAFVLAVTFAASTAFMTPVGYQTNLFVYGPGKYQFSDFIRVGGPLQLLLVVVTTGVSSSSGASDRSRAVSCARSSRQPIPRTPRYSTPVQQIRTPMPAFRTVDDLDTGQRLLMRIDVNAPVEARVSAETTATPRRSESYSTTMTTRSTASRFSRPTPRAIVTTAILVTH